MAIRDIIISLQNSSHIFRITLQSSIFQEQLAWGVLFAVVIHHPELQGNAALKRRYAPIITGCGIMAVLALGGQFVHAPSDQPPVRLRFDNKGGDVVFTHSRHVDMGHACADCHHESPTPEPQPVACGACHPAEYTRPWIDAHKTALDPATCTRCHHATFGKLTWSHQEHVDQYTASCTDCHHGPDIEPEPTACSSCHGDAPDGNTPSLRVAAHVRCETCHSDLYDQKIKGCKSCHEQLPGVPGPAQASCVSCHYDAEAPLLPTRMEAFHGQCMGCHETSGAGPFGEKSCSRCHTR